MTPRNSSDKYYIQLGTKRDAVAAHLRDQILSGEIGPGKRLLQEDIANRLNVSATPVREALRQLEAEGILKHSPNRGVRVSEVHPEDAAEIYLIRAVLESLATRLAVPRLKASDIHQLELLAARFDALVDEGRLKLLRRTNHALHTRIYKISNMPELRRIIDNLWTRFPWDTLHVLPGRAEKSRLQHRQILEAMRDGNADFAGQQMQEHLEDAARDLAGHLAHMAHATKEGKCA